MGPWDFNYMKNSNHATIYMDAAIILRFNCAIHLDKLLQKYIQMLRIRAMCCPLSLLQVLQCEDLQI